MHFLMVLSFRDLSWLEVQTGTNLTQLNKVFHPGRNKPTHQYRLRHNWLQPTEGLEKKLNMTQQWGFATKMANSILGFAGRDVATIPREMLLPLFSVTPHLEDSVQFRAPQYQRDSDTPERVQQRVKG